MACAETSLREKGTFISKVYNKHRFCLVKSSNRLQGDTVEGTQLIIFRSTCTTLQCIKFIIHNGTFSRIYSVHIFDNHALGSKR